MVYFHLCGCFETDTASFCLICTGLAAEKAAQTFCEFAPEPEDMLRLCEAVVMLMLAWKHAHNDSANIQIFWRYNVFRLSLAC